MTNEEKIAAIRKIVDEHQAAEIEGELVDAFTAQMLVKVTDALNPTNREKFLSFPVTRMAEIGWKLVS